MLKCLQCLFYFILFFCSYDFTPLDSSAVYVLSSMARLRRASLSSGGAVSPDCDKLERSCSPQSSSSKSHRSHLSGTASGATPTKCKRPMNAFMLFAKKYRVEYTQMYPGKDNRWTLTRRVQIFFCLCLTPKKSSPSSILSYNLSSPSFTSFN